MKKLCIILMLAVCVGLVMAQQSVIYNISSSALVENAKSANLREAVKTLSQSGHEVYYYNENQVIAGGKSLPPMAQQLKMLPNGRLYLVSKLGDTIPNELETCGDILIDLGSAVLLNSRYNEIELRGYIKNPFTILDLIPMQLGNINSISAGVAETRTEIESLINQVNADSVLYFIQSLQNMQTRYALASNRLTVSNWIKNQFLRFGISNAELHNFQWQNTTQYNVVATITGSVYPDTYIVVGGHHDSITNTTPYDLAPGADDNASGTVAALEMARVMMASGYQPKCSIRFVTFAAEEFGLWGSKAYALYAQNAGLDIRLMMNHDMIANNEGGDLRVRLMPYDGYMEHTDLAAEITSSYTDLEPVYGTMNSSSSDSHSFYARGYPVVYYFEYNFCPWYHSDQDIVANIDPEYCAEVIKASTAVAATYSSMPKAPGNLQVWDSGTGDALTVAWQAPNDPYISHYQILYRNTLTGQEMSMNSDTPVATVSNLVEGVLYDVSVCSVDESGTQSSKVFGSGTPMLLPRTPVAFEAQPNSQSIALSWDANTELDIAGYTLWRSTSPTDNGTAIADIGTDFTSYIDSNVVGSPQYYYYRLTAYDSDNNNSLPTVAVSSRPVSLNCGILLVDESKNLGGTSPFQPNDEMVDDFYLNLLELHTPAAIIDLEQETSPLRLADLGIYSTIIWHGNEYSDTGYPFTILEALKQYINLGGNVLFSLYHPRQAFEQSSSYPVTFTANSFMRQVLGIASADYSSSARFKYAMPAIDNISMIQVDSLKTSAAFNGHIIRVEGLTPVDAGDLLYTYGSDYPNGSSQGSLNGKGIAVAHQYGNGKAVSLSFPLYNMELDASREFVNFVMQSVFNEPVSNEDGVIPAITGIKVMPNYPNPFISETSFIVASADKQHPISVEVYNIKGQLVRSLHSGMPEIKTSYTWDGRDSQGKAVSSGVYVIRAHQKGVNSARKVLLLK